LKNNWSIIRASAKYPKIKNLLKITGYMLLGKLQAVKTFYNVCTKMDLPVSEKRILSHYSRCIIIYDVLQ